MTSNSGNECMMTVGPTDLFSQLQRLRLSDGTSAGERIRTTVVTTPPAERNQLPRTMSITSSTSNGSGAATATTMAARHYSHDSLSVPFASPQLTLTLPEYTTHTHQHSNGGSNSRDVAQTQGPHARRSSSMHQQQQSQHHQHDHDLHHEAVSMPDLASLALHVNNKQQQQQHQQQCAYDEDASRRTMMSNNSVVSGSNRNNYDDVSSSVASPLCSFVARNAYTLTHVPAPTQQQQQQQQPQQTAFVPPAHVSSSGYASDAVSGSLADYNNNNYPVMHSPYASPQSSIPHLSATQRPVSSPSLHTGTTLTLAPAPAGMSTVTPRAPVAIAVEPLHPTVLQFLQNALPGTGNNNKGNTTSTSTSTTMTGVNDVSALVAFASTLPATTMFARAPESVCASATVQSGMSATANAVAAAVATTIASTSTSSSSSNNNNGVTVDSQAATPTATVSPSTRDKRNKHKLQQQQQQQQQHEGVAYDKSSTLTMDAVHVDAIRTTAPRAVATVAAQRADVNKARRSDSNNHNNHHNEDDNTPPLPPPQQSPQQKQRRQQQHQHDAALAMTDDTGGSNSSHSRSSSSSSNGGGGGSGGGGTRRRRGSLDSGAVHTHMTVAAAIAANAFVCEALGCAWTDNTCVRTPIIRTLPDVPQGGRYIVVGDVHGCVEQLEALVAKVKYVQGKDCLVIIGDYVNKGPDSVGVVRACQRLRALGVLGNHDYTLLRCCAQHRRKRFTPQELRDPVKQLARDFPLECEYYLRSLPHMLRLPAYGVLLVHAGVNPQYALEAQSIREIMHMRRLVPVSATSDEPTTTTSTSHGNNNDNNNNNGNDDAGDDGNSGGGAAGSSLATRVAHTRTCQQHKDTTSHMRVTVGSGAAKKTMFVTTTTADATTTTARTPMTTPAATATTTTTTTATAAAGVRYRVLEKGCEGTPWAERWSGPQHIVFGHDAYAGFQCHPHAYGIDTGCVYGDPLTCVVYSAAAPHGEFFSVPGLPRYSNERLGLPPPSADIYEQLQSSDVSRAIIRPTTSASLATTTTAAAAAAATARCTPAAFLTTPPSTPALTSSSSSGGGGGAAATAVVASAHTFLATPVNAPATRAHGGHLVVVVGAGAARTTTTTTTTTRAVAAAAAATTGTRTQHGSTLHTSVLEGNTQAWRGMRLPSPATLPPSAATSARGASVTATQHNNYNSNSNNCAASPSSLMSGALDKAASISVREVQKATLLALSATHELRALVTVLMMPLYERHYDAMMQDDVDDNVAQQSFWCPFVQAVLEAMLQLTSSSSSTTKSSSSSNGKESDDNNNNKKEHSDGCGDNKSWNAAGQHAAAMMPTGAIAAAAAAATTSSASTAPQTYVTALALMEECVDYIMHFVLPVCEAMRYVRTTVRPQLRAVVADATPGLWSRAVQKYVATVLQQADEDDKDDDDAKGRCGGGGGDGGGNNKDNKNKSSNNDDEAAHTQRV